MTHSRWPGGRLARAVATSLILAGARTAAASFMTAWVVTGMSPAGAAAAAVPAAATAGASVVAVPQPAKPPCYAWTGGGQPPDPGGTDHNNYLDDTLTAVGASPDSSSVWAVGHYYDGTAEQTLAIHCC
jgi:hypothetical protein